jgi:hypothetical protein
MGMVGEGGDIRVRVGGMGIIEGGGKGVGLET